MADAATVLTKKLRRGGVARSPLNDSDLTGESLARGVEDRIRILVKTMTGAGVGSARVCKLADAIGEIGTPAMLAVVDVEDADTPALIHAQSQLVYHLIDLMLGGDPGAAPEPAERVFTAIDMALVRLHLDAVLAAFVHAIGVGFGQRLTKRLAIRDQRQTVTQLRLAPDYIDVLVFDVDLTLGEAGRTGKLSIVLPLSALDVIRASVQERNQQAARDRPNDLWKAVMRRAAAAAPVPVDGVLHRQTLSVAALQALEVGQILEIPRQAVDEIRLTIPQPGGRTAVLATGRLGAFQDNKVVKLVTPPDRRVVAHVERALRPAAVAPAALPAPNEPHQLPPPSEETADPEAWEARSGSG